MPKNQNGYNILRAYSTLWKEPSNPPSPKHKTNSFLYECVVSVCHVWLWQAKQRFPHRQAWTGKQVLLEQLRMRTWGVSTNLIKESASAASQPPNVIYVTVSHKFMTACKQRAKGKQLSLLQQPSRSTHHGFHTRKDNVPRKQQKSHLKNAIIKKNNSLKGLKNQSLHWKPHRSLVFGKRRYENTLK